MAYHALTLGNSRTEVLHEIVRHAPLKHRHSVLLYVLFGILIPATYTQVVLAEPAPWRIQGGTDDRSVDQPLVFHGDPGVKFLAPNIQQFRLHRLSAPAARIPLVFHWKPSAFEIAEDVLIDAVRLHLDDMRWDTPGQMTRLKNANRGPAKVEIQLHALAPLAPNGRYRLDWTYQVKGADDLVTSSCEFTTSATRPEGNFRRPPSPPVAHYYLCEALFCRREGPPFLARGIAPHRNPSQRGLPIVGFNSDNTSVNPPDGFAPIKRTKRVREMMEALVPVKPKPRLAFASGYIHVNSQQLNNQRGIGIFVSDTGTNAAAPSKVGEVTYSFFGGVFYRIERIERNVERLREDPDFYAQRTTEMMNELAARRDVLLPADKARRAAAAAMLERIRLRQKNMRPSPAERTGIPGVAPVKETE